MSDHPNPDLQNRSKGKRYKLISCEIIYREMCLLAAQSEHIVDAQFLRKGLHDAGAQEMQADLQEAINAVPQDTYDAILLGYARCSDGVVGLAAPNIPLVIPRAHDCITFFFGSRVAYDGYFNSSPGTYFRTTGWTERASQDDDSIMHELGLGRTYAEYAAKYGPDNAKYIMETIGGWEVNYKCLAYIDMGLPPDEQYAQLAREEARARDLEFRLLKGDMSLLGKLINGPWDPAEFLVVQPGQKIISDDEGAILTAVDNSHDN